MTPLRCLLILVALCAFGALEASFVGWREHGRFGPSNSSGHWNNTNATHHFRPGRSPGRHHLNLGNSSAPGHWNGTQPSNSSGHWNNSHFRPGRSPGRHHLNGTNFGNASFVPGGPFNFSGQHNATFIPNFNLTSPIHGHGHHRFNGTSLGNSTFVPSWNNTGHWNASRPLLNRPHVVQGPRVQRPRPRSWRPLVYPGHRPVQQPGYRPAYNSTWYRPGNYSRPANYSRPYYG